MQQLIELIKPYNELLILACAIVGTINIVLVMLLILKKHKIEKRTEIMAAEIVASFKEEPVKKGMFNIKNERGLIDGGVIIALVGVAMVAFISGRETVPKSAIVNKEEISLDNSVYQCREVRRKMIRYYDVQSGTYKYLPLNKNEGCFK
jgi:small neutral amino acid transporter SnatA (MarC family)